MPKKYKGIYTFDLTVEAMSKDEAEYKLGCLLSDISGSNDGSELLSNLSPEMIEEVSPNRNIKN